MKHHNQMAVEQLKNIGFPLPNIRKSLHKLTGIDQYEIARKVGLSRQAITRTMDGSRSNPDTQEKIAEIFKIPIDVLFESDAERQ